MFGRKSVFELAKKEGLDPEEIELELIDAGCESIEVEEDKMFVYGDFTAFGTLSKAIDDLQIEVLKANLQRIPTSPIDLTEEQMVDVEKLLDKIEEDDDVQQVFTNIA
jgi:transcriptional/translational regulatory protein YebC/TACO1